MDPLDVTHGEMRCWRAGFGASLVRGTSTLPALGFFKLYFCMEEAEMPTNHCQSQASQQS